MEYYTVRKNEVLVFSATWMDLEIIILSEKLTERKSYMISHRQNAKIMHMNCSTK